MRLSVLMTIWERETPVLDAVFGSLKPQPFDELVIVLDRSPLEIIRHCRHWWYGDKRVVFTDIAGPPGWSSPVPGWNRMNEYGSGSRLRRPSGWMPMTVPGPSTATSWSSSTAFIASRRSSRYTGGHIAPPVTPRFTSMPVIESYHDCVRTGK